MRRGMRILGEKFDWLSEINGRNAAKLFLALHPVLFSFGIFGGHLFQEHRQAAR